MDEMPPEAAVKKEVKGKSNNKVKIIVLIVVLLSIAITIAIAGIWISNSHAKAAVHSSKQAAKPVAPELYFSITPPFIVNFQTMGRIRYMQIGVDIMTHDPRAMDVLKNDLPLIKNNLLALFDAQDFDVMTTPQGRQALREAALEEVQKIMMSKIGVPAVEAVLFTSFILQ